MTVAGRQVGGGEGQRIARMVMRVVVVAMGRRGSRSSAPGLRFDVRGGGGGSRRCRSRPDGQPVAYSRRAGRLEQERSVGLVMRVSAETGRTGHARHRIAAAQIMRRRIGRLIAS